MRSIIASLALRTLGVLGFLVLVLQTLAAMERGQWVLFCLGWAAVMWLLWLAGEWSWKGE